MVERLLDRGTRRVEERVDSFLSFCVELDSVYCMHAPLPKTEATNNNNSNNNNNNSEQQL